MNIKRKGNEFFITSLYEVNRLIEEKTTPRDSTKETEEDILRRTVPKVYYDLLKAFSKKDSDIILLYRSYDYKI
jgi:hypothetical protein